MRDHIIYIIFVVKNPENLPTELHVTTYLSGKNETHHIKDDQPNPRHDPWVLQHARPVNSHMQTHT